MYRHLLFLSGAFLLFSNFSCPDECDEEFGLMQAIASVSVESPREEPYAVGESIWLSSTFPAQQEMNGSFFTISENGGFVITEVFSLTEDSMFIQAARADFDLNTSAGTILPASSNSNPAAVVLQYNCLNGLCNFRQGFQPNTAGTYILRVSGTVLDEVSAPFRYCIPPALVITGLEGGANLPEDALDYPLRSDLVSSFFWEPVDLQFQENIYYFTVE